MANRTEARAQALVQAHADLAASRQVVLEALPIGQPGTGFDVVINATASSLAGGEVPVPDTVLREGTLAYDMMYGPAAQGFHGLGARPRRGAARRAGHAGGAGRRGVRRLARRAPPAAQVLQELRAQL